LNGTKANVVHGHRADVIVVFATTGNGGATAFVLRGEHRGLSARVHADALGMRAAPRATLTFENVDVSDDARLGPVLEWVYQQGARFDSWEERLRYDLWTQAFERFGGNA
jgi:alkylation response protein AidB-like acyl-CoA dehydrogenase